MDTPKRVLCIMDIACVGRAALSAVLPVLSACGVQACGLPTTLLSTHTGGFGEVTVQDAAAFCGDALEHYHAEGVVFDAVYTGYLMREEEFSLAHRAFDLYPKALRLVDPVLGDGGKPYSKTTPETVKRMQTLAKRANIITPNRTETALLLGQTPKEDLSVADLLDRLHALSALSREVVATSMPMPNGATGIYCFGPAGTCRTVPSHTVPGSYPGTGDLFAAALLGLKLQGLSTAEAAKRAAAFVEAAVHNTYENGGEARQGVWFEPQLYKLCPQRPQ